MGWYDYSYAPYVNVATRRANAAKEMAKLRKKGRVVLPVQIEGRAIATTFWGRAWCSNLEAYSDYSNRLPRGRTYVRNGSVIDLQIKSGEISALVSGSEIYRVDIRIKPVARTTWDAVISQCAGQIGSLIELLQGKLAKSVMEVVTRQRDGLFPAPSEIDIDCSCPDSAGMCKHIAAALYGVGNRLDHQPDLLFKLRQVDHLELIANLADIAKPADPATKAKTIAAGDLTEVFGIELEGSSPADVPVHKSTQSESHLEKPKATKRRAAKAKKPIQNIKQIVRLTALPSAKPPVPPKRLPSLSRRRSGQDH